MIEIKQSQIIKLLRLALGIWGVEDEDDWPDKRKIVPKKRAISRILDKITLDIGHQVEIFDVIEKGMFKNDDPEYKHIQKELTKLGYKVKVNE